MSVYVHHKNYRIKLEIKFIVTFTRADLEPDHINRCGPLPVMVWHPCPVSYTGAIRAWTAEAKALVLHCFDISGVTYKSLVSTLWLLACTRGRLLLRPFFIYAVYLAGVTEGVMTETLMLLFPPLYHNALIELTQLTLFLWNPIDLSSPSWLCSEVAQSSLHLKGMPARQVLIRTFIHLNLCFIPYSSVLSFREA
jgi:hypothetical protein